MTLMIRVDRLNLTEGYFYIQIDNEKSFYILILPNDKINCEYTISVLLGRIFYKVKKEENVINYCICKDIYNYKYLYKIIEYKHLILIKYVNIINIFNLYYRYIIRMFYIKTNKTYNKNKINIYKYFNTMSNYKCIAFI